MFWRKHLVEKFLLIVLLLIATLPINSTYAYAGVRGGYYLLAFPLDSESEQKVAPLLKKYFNQALKNIYDGCSSESTDVELVYLKKRPRSLEANYVKKAVSGDNKELNKVRTIIGNYRDFEIENGFDALIAYGYKSGKITFWGISSVPEEKNTIAISKDSSDRNIAMAVCKVLSPLPYAFGP